MKTHVIIDSETNKPVGLAVNFVTEDCNSDLDTFKANCKPEWGWDEAKQEEVFAAVMEEVNTPPPARLTEPAPPKPKNK